jgi:hypothetical protein
MSVSDNWKFVPVNKGIPNVKHKAVKSLQQIGQALFIKKVALLLFYGFPTYLPTFLLHIVCTKNVTSGYICGLSS